MPELDDISWDELAQSIADGEAVLLLGPDAIPLYSTQGQPSDDVDATTSFSKLSRNRILQTLSEKELNHFYERDNLFQFSSAPAKQKAMKEVRNVLREDAWLPDSELLRQIVAIPFPVVVNINPDKYVYEAFLKYYREPQFDYFTSKDKPNPPVLDFPDGMNKPLVYNLCGSVLDKLDSVILDYFDLFELLKNILADQGVSEHLTRKLQEADRFILLGFELERWYFQLFLHYLNKLDYNPFNSAKQNFPIVSWISDASREFVMYQFKIKHIAPTRQGFESLYQACERKGILRKLHEPGSKIETDIRLLAVQNKFEEAFNLLETHLGEEKRTIELPHLRSRLAEWLVAKKAGTEDNNYLSMEINRIRYTLLTYANQIRQEE